eukprot:3231779-Pleurochrysis_carterae.AAC.1
MPPQWRCRISAQIPPMKRSSASACILLRETACIASAILLYCVFRTCFGSGSEIPMSAIARARSRSRSRSSEPRQSRMALNGMSAPATADCAETRASTAAAAAACARAHAVSALERKRLSSSRIASPPHAAHHSRARKRSVVSIDARSHADEISYAE